MSPDFRLRSAPLCLYRQWRHRPARCTSFASRPKTIHSPTVSGRRLPSSASPRGLQRETRPHAGKSSAARGQVQPLWHPPPSASPRSPPSRRACAGPTRRSEGRQGKLAPRLARHQFRDQRLEIEKPASTGVELGHGEKVGVALRTASARSLVDRMRGIVCRPEASVLQSIEQPLWRATHRAPFRSQGSLDQRQLVFRPLESARWSDRIRSRQCGARRSRSIAGRPPSRQFGAWASTGGVRTRSSRFACHHAPGHDDLESTLPKTKRRRHRVLDRFLA